MSLRSLSLSQDPSWELTESSFIREVLSTRAMCRFTSCRSGLQNIRGCVLSPSRCSPPNEYGAPMVDPCLVLAKHHARTFDRQLRCPASLAKSRPSIRFFSAPMPSSCPRAASSRCSPLGFALDFISSSYMSQLLSPSRVSKRLPPVSR